MAALNDKKQMVQRDAMYFPFRWFDTLDCLPDGDWRPMMRAIRSYAQTGENPDFTGYMAALWNEIKQRIDFDRDKYYAVCERNRNNGKLGGRPKSKNPQNPMGYLGYQKKPTKPKKPEADADAEADALKESILTDTKENAAPEASLFSLPQTNDSVITSSLQPNGNFKKWSDEHFSRSIDEAIQDHPEYSAFRDQFTTYWTEPDAKGRPKYQLQQTWSTAGRLATWYRNNAGFTRTPPAAIPSEDEQLRRIQGGF